MKFLLELGRLPQNMVVKFPSLMCTKITEDNENINSIQNNRISSWLPAKTKLALIINKIKQILCFLQNKRNLNDHSFHYDPQYYYAKYLWQHTIDLDDVASSKLEVHDINRYTVLCCGTWFNHTNKLNVSKTVEHKQIGQNESQKMDQWDTLIQCTVKNQVNWSVSSSNHCSPTNLIICWGNILIAEKTLSNCLFNLID